MNPYWYWYLIFIPLGAIVTVSPLWRFVKFFETVFHEFGHALVGVLLGQKLHGFKLRLNTSGETVTMSHGYGFRAICTQLAGYPAPVILGILTLYYGYQGAGIQVVWFYLIVTIFMALFIRNLFGFIPLMIVAGISGVALWLNTYNIQGVFIFTVLIGTMLTVSGLKSFLDLFKYLPEGSDVWMLKDKTYVGQRFWIVLMFIASLGFIMADMYVISWISDTVNSIFSGINHF